MALGVRAGEAAAAAPLWRRLAPAIIIIMFIISVSAIIIMLTSY